MQQPHNCDHPEDAVVIKVISAVVCVETTVFYCNKCNTAISKPQANS